MRWAAAIGWTALLLYAVWGPPPTRAPLFAYEDKVFHLGGFGGLAAAWMWALDRPRAVVLIGVLAAVVTEVGQAFLPWPRSPEWADGVADLVGVGLGVGLAWWVLRQPPLRRKSRTPKRGSASRSGTPR